MSYNNKHPLEDIKLDDTVWFSASGTPYNISERTIDHVVAVINLLHQRNVVIPIALFKRHDERHKLNAEIFKGLK